jgi:flagellar basal body-associated protein FliL
LQFLNILKDSGVQKHFKNGAIPKSHKSRAYQNSVKMKKILTKILAIILIVVTLSSCATLFGGPVTACQKTKPASGQAQRDVRVGALVLDIILFTPSLIVDFATGAIYKPCK